MEQIEIYKENSMKTELELMGSVDTSKKYYTHDTFTGDPVAVEFRELTDKEWEDLFGPIRFRSKHHHERFTYKGDKYFVNSDGQMQMVLGDNRRPKFLDDGDAATVEELLDSLRGDLIGRPTNPERTASPITHDGRELSFVEQLRTGAIDPEDLKANLQREPEVKGSNLLEALVALERSLSMALENESSEPSDLDKLIMEINSWDW